MLVRLFYQATYYWEWLGFVQAVHETGVAVGDVAPVEYMSKLLRDFNPNKHKINHDGYNRDETNHVD